MRQATAAAIRKNTATILRAPRKLPVAEAVNKFMRVPVGVGNRAGMYRTRLCRPVNPRSAGNGPH